MEDRLTLLAEFCDYCLTSLSICLLILEATIPSGQCRCWSDDGLMLAGPKDASVSVEVDAQPGIPPNLLGWPGLPIGAGNPLQASSVVHLQ